VSNVFSADLLEDPALSWEASRWKHCCQAALGRVLEHIDLNNLVAERQQVLLLDCSIPIFLAIELKCILDSRVDSEVEYWPIPLLEPVLNHVA